MQKSRLSTEQSTENPQHEARRASIETLQEFYSTVVAIALAGGVEKLIAEFHGEQRLAMIALSIAFLSTIIPFYHGMNRYLYEAHIARRQVGPGGRTSPVLLDVFVFVVEGCVLFAMGRSIAAPAQFLFLWSFLLLVDIVWSLFVWHRQRGEKPIWARNNFFWGLGVWLVWLSLPHISQLEILGPGWVRAAQVYVLALAEIGRSITDYIGHWDYYFPTPE